MGWAIVGTDQVASVENPIDDHILPYPIDWWPGA